MNTILLDTNVLVYFIDPRNRDRQDRAIDLIETLAENQMGRLSIQNLSEFLNVSKKFSDLISLSEVIGQVNRWVNIFPVFDLTTMILQEAMRGLQVHQLSYYDAQIWATARLNQVPVVFSEDFQDGIVLDGVLITNPFSQGFDLNQWI